MAAVPKMERLISSVFSLDCHLGKTGMAETASNIVLALTRRG